MSLAPLAVSAAPPPSPCADCGRPIEATRARHCNRCNARARRLYHPTPEIDAAIRRLYGGRRRHGDVAKLAAAIGWPVNSVSRRATQLGVLTTRRGRWEEREKLLLERYACYPTPVIRVKLREHGYHRSISAIEKMVVKTQARLNNPHYTTGRLAACMGVSVTVVHRWVRQKLLRARRRQTAHEHDAYLFRESDVRAFLLAHPLAYDHRKAEWLWMLDLIMEGRVAGSFHAAGAPAAERDDPEGAGGSDQWTPGMVEGSRGPESALLQ